MKLWELILLSLHLSGNELRPEGLQGGLQGMGPGNRGKGSRMEREKGNLPSMQDDGRGGGRNVESDNFGVLLVFFEACTHGRHSTHDVGGYNFWE